MAFVLLLVLVRREDISNVRVVLANAGGRVVFVAQEGRLSPRAVGPELIQVVNAEGRVVSASEGMAGYPRVKFPAPAPSEGRRHGRSCHIQAPGGPCFIVIAFALGTGNDRRVVYTLAPEPGLVPHPQLAALMAASVPVLAGLTGYGVWRAAGRMMDPVDAIRAELDEITATDLQRRVPVPEHRDEVARLAKSVNATLDRLEGAVARLRGYVADVSHELRSPLTGLRMELELALSDPDASDPYETLEAVLANTERLHAVLDDLLAIARLEANPNFAREPVDLQMLADQEVLRRPRRSRFAVTDGDPVIVNGGRSELGRLITSLLDNADRHAATSVTITVRAEPDGTAVVEVIDDGPGIAAADRERVFERFTRLDEGRHRDAGGTGLGLAVSRDIATAHGGTLILAERTDDQPGARFVLRLPPG
ncbi:sensor histidine kinase [Actinomadura sp. 9N407]|uniref:sensor histidine kinase n=1 Tax=Actinomadura sp. 9N407 TaxID=3375154 RepID=UPI003795CCAE